MVLRLSYKRISRSGRTKSRLTCFASRNGPSPRLLATWARVSSPVISAVFANSVGSFLGVDQPTVGAGDSVFPVITSRPTIGGPFTGSDEVAESTGAFSAELLKPERLQASFFYRRTDAARFGQLSTALRENLSMALSDALDAEIVNGTDGLLNGTNLANHNVSAATTYDLFLSQFGFARVDGRYAGSVADIRTVMGAGSYAAAGAKYRGNNGDRTAASELERLTAGLRVSAHVPAVVSTKQNNIVRLGTRRDMVSPLWEGPVLIPDEVTQAKKGEIVITAVLLHAVKIIRSDGFFKQASPGVRAFANARNTPIGAGWSGQVGNGASSAG